MKKTFQQVPDYKSLESMNALLHRLEVGFIVERRDENIGTQLSIWNGEADAPGLPPRFIAFLGFKVPKVELLDAEFDNFAAYCFTAKMTNSCFEDENFRYYFSLEHQSLFVLDSKVFIALRAPTFFRPKDTIQGFLDDHTLQLPQS